MRNMSDIIVRAFQNEPVKLKAVSYDDGRVEVAGVDEEKSINLPQEFVYSFQDDLFGNLREAYERGDERSLSHLWQQASPYRPILEA